MPKPSFGKSAARSCSLVVAVSYCIPIGIWAVPPGAFGLSDDGIALVAGSMTVFPVVFGPLAGLTAGVLMAVDKGCYRVPFESASFLSSGANAQSTRFANNEADSPLADTVSASSRTQMRL